MPLIIKWPGVTKPGWVSRRAGHQHRPVSHLPRRRRSALRPNQHLDGLNLQPLLAGEASLGRKSLFWHFPHYNEHPSSVPSSVIRRGPWKLIETFDPEGVELYNLADDLGETNNLAAAQTRAGQRPARRTGRVAADVGAEMMRPNPDYDPDAQLPKKEKEESRHET